MLCNVVVLATQGSGFTTFPWVGACGRALIPHSFQRWCCCFQVPKFPQGSLLDATGWAPSVFRFAVPNVMPGDLIEVDMMFTKKLHLQKDCYQLHIPLTFPASIVDQYQGLQVQQLTHLVCCFILAPQGRWSNAGVLLPVDLVFFACR